MPPQPPTGPSTPVWSDHIDWVPDVFACLWLTLERDIRRIVGDAWVHQRPAELESFIDLLVRAPDGGLPPEIQRYLQGTDPLHPSLRFSVPGQDWTRRAFVVAQSIDLAFEAIRPKAPRVRGLRTADGGLGAFKDRRLEHGSYGRRPDILGHVIPRGPLHEGRNRVGGSGDNLETQFAHLAVIPPKALGSAYGLNVRVLPRRSGAVIPDVGRIGFVPLAEQADDLRFHPIKPADGGAFLDALPVDEAILADRAVDALARLAAGGANVALFPELCVGPTARRRIREGLRGMPANSLSLVILGSGISDESAGDGRFYNECVAVNGRGDVLWRQRKMNGYEMGAVTMTDCGIDHAVPDMDHREWTRSGDVLELVDTDQGRRLMVLICEDLEQDTPSRTACRLMQPDWVFTPVLDGSLKVGRWTHQRGWDLARKFGQRVVVANSAILHARARRKEPATDETCGVGLCVDSAQPRRFHIAEISLSDPSPSWRIVEWKPERWDVVEVVHGSRTTAKT